LPIKDITLSGGVGFGGVYQDLSATGGGATFTDSRFDKAFQAMFGLDYHFTEVFSLGMGYKILVTLPEDTWALFGPLPEKPDNHADHAVTAVFRFQF
jgi:opacity protein-like surface antigen